MGKSTVIGTNDAFIKRPIVVKLKNGFGKMGTSLSRIGRALLYPIAMLPLAAILLRVGAAIPTDTPFAEVVSKILLTPANAIFDFLPIFFAVGVAFGFAKDYRGEAAICGLAGMLIMMMMIGSPSLLGSAGQDLTQVIYGDVSFGQPAITIGGTTYTAGFHTIFGQQASGGAIRDSYDSILASNVLNGIIAGSIVAFIYNRFNGIELPGSLSFFSGRRLVPVMVLMLVTLFAILWAVVFPWVGYVLFQFSEALGAATGDRYANAGIMAVYGFLNRLLVPFGLHHIPNTLFWFVFGSHPAATGGGVVNGDINIFGLGAVAGNNSGTFQSGFFPTFLFGVPLLVAAIWYRAEKSERPKVIGLLAGGAFISFFTGIAEPVEFTFLFVAPLLYVNHALMTGIFAGITGLFGVQLGFGFSAGAVDYALSIPRSLELIRANKTGLEAVFANPGWIFVIGPACGAGYFFSSSYLIKRFNMQTPGRGTNKVTSTKGFDFNAIGAGGGGAKANAAADK